MQTQTPLSMGYLSLDEIEMLAELSQPRLVAVMGVSISLSLLLVAAALYRIYTSPTFFNIGVLMCTLTLTLNDAWYFLVTGLRWSPNSFEIMRSLNPVLSGYLIAGLCFERFKVFGQTSHASWYSTPVRRICHTVNFAIFAVCSAVLTLSFVNLDLTVFLNYDPVRKLAILISIAFTLLADVSTSVLAIRIVLAIYASSLAATLPSSAAAAKPTLMAAAGLCERVTMTRHRAIGRKVLLALVGMITSCLTGTVIYMLARTTFGHSLSYLFCRVYVMFALIQWQLVVDLVRGSTALNADACRLDSEYQFACVEHMGCQLSSHGTFLSADPSYVGDWVRRDSEGQVTAVSAATSKASKSSARTQRTKSTLFMSQAPGSPVLSRARPNSFATTPSAPHSSNSGLSAATTVSGSGSVSPSQRNKRLSMLAPAHIQTNVVHTRSPLALASPAVLSSSPSQSPGHTHLLGHDPSSPLSFQPPSVRTVSLPRSNAS